MHHTAGRLLVLLRSTDDLGIFRKSSRNRRKPARQMTGEACEDEMCTFPTRLKLADAAMTFHGIDFNPLVLFHTFLTSSL
jgi:hypothetical protein